nr:PREDICTED: TRIO and F-actin-binding protein [Equus przewalskii]
MEEVAENAPREHFEANALAQSCCLNCFHPEEAHSPRHQEPQSPLSAEVPYCDLPHRSPASEDLLGPSTSGCQSAVGLGLGPGPERGPAGLPTEGPTAAPRSGSREAEAVPYLEGPASHLCHGFDRGPDSREGPASHLCHGFDRGPDSRTGSGPDRDAPDGTSDVSSVDWDTVERWEAVPSWDKLTVMIPRKPQEGPRADSSRRAPSVLNWSPVGGDTAGQKKEDTGSGSRSAGQHWAKLRGESRYFSVERHQPALNPAASGTPQSGPRSATSQASSLHRSAQKDVAQAASTQFDTPPASSPARTTQRDNPRTSSTQQDVPRTSSTQRNTPRASSPSRTTQRDNLRTSSTQLNNPQVSSPTKATQEDNSRTSSTQQDNPQTSFPTCTPQRENSRTSCAQSDNPRASSPNRPTQRESSRTPCAQRDNPRASSPNRPTQWESFRTPCAQRDNPRASSPNRPTQWESSRTPCAQRDNPRASSPNRPTQWESSRITCAQRDNPRASSPNRATQRESSRTPCAQRDNPRGSSPNRATQRDNPRTSCIQQNSPRTSSTQRANPKTSCTQWDNLRTSFIQRDNPRSSSFWQGNPGSSSPQCCTQQDNPGPSSPRRSTQQNNPRNSSPHRTNKDIPWASFPLRPTPSDGPRTSSPSRSKQSEVPWASIALRPTQGDRPQASSPARPAQRDPLQSSSGPTQHSSSSRATSSSHAFPFLPDTSDAEIQSPQHAPPQFPPPVCIGYRDAPRASSPPRQAPEPSLLFQDLPRASTESLVPSTDSLHEPPHIPTPVCIGHRDAPSFSSPPRQAPEPSLFFQDPPGTSMESLAPSTDSLRGSPVLPPQVCIGHRDAPRASSPPRHPPSDLALLAPSPPPGSSGGSRSSMPPGETRHNLEREEYTMLADLPPPRRLAQRDPGPQCSSGGRTRSPGRAEVERLFGQERRKSEAPGAFQAQQEGRSQRPGQGQSQLLRRQSSPALSREVTKPLVKQAEPAQRSRAEPPRPRSPERRPEGDRRLQGSSPPPRTSARTPERQQRTERPPESGRVGQRQPLVGWRSQEELPGSRGPHRQLERGWSSQEEDLGLGGWQGLGEPSWGAARAPEGTHRGPPRESEESWGQLEAWEEPPDRPAQRGWGSLQELSSPHQPGSPPENSRAGPAEFSKSWKPEMPIARDGGVEGTCPHLHGPEWRPELDWRNLVGLLGAPREEAWARVEEPMLTSRLPRLDWEGLLELLQAQLPRKDPAGHWGGLATALGSEVGFPGTEGVLEREQHGQPEGWAEATLVNGHSPGQWPQSSAQPPSPACISTQWPKSKVISGPEALAMAGLEETGQLGSRSPAEGPSSTQWEFQPEEPEESEPSRGQDSLTEEKQTDSADKRPAEGKPGSLLKGRLVTSWRMPGDRPTLFNPFLLSLGVLRWQRPDLLNFKKGWMSILDEPGEWKKHWFVLTDSSLKYYRDSTAEEADELDGEIDLRSCTDVTEFAVQRNYGFQIHTKDAVYTLSAMTSGIRRNWIEALRKTVRPTSAPDVTKLSDSNKENTLHGHGTQKGSLKAGEPRVGSEVISRGGGLRKADGQRPSLDYVELSPLTQGSPQRARTPARTLDRPAKQEELERDLAQRSEERRKWFEATDSRATETPAGEAPRRSLGAPLTEDQQSRLSEEIEKKWQELEKLPLRENKRVPLTALLNQSRGERRGPPSDSHEALEKEVQSLRAQLEVWRLQGEAPQGAPRSQEDGHVPPGYISQTRPLSCERLCDLPEVSRPGDVRGGI